MNGHRDVGDAVTPNFLRACVRESYGSVRHLRHAPPPAPPLKRGEFRDQDPSLKMGCGLFVLRLPVIHPRNTRNPRTAP